MHIESGFGTGFLLYVWGVEAVQHRDSYHLPFSSFSHFPIALWAVSLCRVFLSCAVLHWRSSKLSTQHPEDGRESGRGRQRVWKRKPESMEENGREYGRESQRVWKRTAESMEEDGREYGRGWQRVWKRTAGSLEEDDRVWKRMAESLVMATIEGKWELKAGESGRRKTEWIDNIREW